MSRDDRYLGNLRTRRGGRRRRRLRPNGRRLIALQWLGRSTLIDALRQAIDRVAQFLDRVLEMSQPIAHLKERDDAKEDNEPQQDHRESSGVRIC